MQWGKDGEPFVAEGNCIVKCRKGGEAFSDMVNRWKTVRWSETMWNCLMMWGKRGSQSNGHKKTLIAKIVLPIRFL
jgi:hypothetical protein